MYALVLALLKIRTKFIHSGLFRNNYRKGVDSESQSHCVLKIMNDLPCVIRSKKATNLVLQLTAAAKLLPLITCQPAFSSPRSASTAINLCTSEATSLSNWYLLAASSQTTIAKGRQWFRAAQLDEEFTSDSSLHEKWRHVCEPGAVLGHWNDLDFLMFFFVGV